MQRQRSLEGLDSPPVLLGGLNQYRNYPSRSSCLLTEHYYPLNPQDKGLDYPNYLTAKPNSTKPNINSSRKPRASPEAR